MDGENCVIGSNRGKGKRIHGVSGSHDRMHDHLLDDSGEQQIEKVPKHPSRQRRKEERQLRKRQGGRVGGEERLVLRDVHARRDPPVDSIDRLFR